MYTAGGVPQHTWGVARAVPTGSASHGGLVCATALTGRGQAGRVVVGGNVPRLLVFNTSGADATREPTVVPSPRAPSVIRSGRMLVVGTTAGTLDFYDGGLRSDSVQRTLRVHSGGVTDVAVRGELVVTCGVTKRGGARGHRYSPDVMLQVFDLRMMRQLAPIPITTPGSAPSMLGYLHNDPTGQVSDKLTRLTGGS